jgi:outer membrane protein
MRTSLIALVIFGASTSAAAAAATTADIKIGYIDMGRALNEVEDGKSAKGRLQADFGEKQKKLDAMQTDLKAKKEEFDKKATMMEASVKAQKQEELQRKLIELQQTYMQLQKELVDKESQLTTEIAGKLRKVIDKLGDRDSYFMILDIGDNVLYYKRHLDVTEQVVQEYNRQYGGKK